MECIIDFRFHDENSHSINERPSNQLANILHSTTAKKKQHRALKPAPFARVADYSAHKITHCIE